MDEANNWRHQQHLVEAVVEAHWAGLDLPCRISIRKTYFNAFSWWPVALQEFSKVSTALLILRPIWAEHYSFTEDNTEVQNCKVKPFCYTKWTMSLRHPFFASSSKWKAVRGNQNSWRLDWGIRDKVGFGSTLTQRSCTKRVMTCMTMLLWSWSKMT